MSVVTSQKNPIKSVISVDKQWLFSHVRIRGYCGITVGLSASTFAYLMRWPVFRLIWLKLTFSESEVAGCKATGQVTRDFPISAGAMKYSKRNKEPVKQSEKNKNK